MLVALSCLLLLYTSMTEAHTMTAASVKAFTSHERNLTLHLLDDTKYSPLTRPVDSWNNTVAVQLGLDILNIVDVDEKRSAITLNVWMKYTWTDLLLSWDPADFGGLSQIALPADRVWRPDITLFNSADNTMGEPEVKRNVVVYPSGYVLWVPMAQIKSSCTFNIRHFPFDKHDCEVKYGSWVYDESRINLTFYEDSPNIDDSQKREHNEWIWETKPGARHSKKYECCTERYVDLTFKFGLERKSEYYMCTIVAPAIFIAFLIPFLFVLNHSNKFPLGAGMIISLSILMEMLAEQIPTAHSDVPILAQYLAGLFGLITLAFILCTFTSNLANRAEYHTNAPRFLRKLLVGCIGRLVCVNPSDYSMLEYGPPVSMQHLETMDGGTEPSFNSDMAGIVPPKSSSGGSGRLQWRLMAAVLDRCFFVLFLAAIVVFTITVISH
jgi:hypothetical protein